MAGLTIELCPETGMGSLLARGSKIDLMPDEVEAVRAAGADANGIRQVLAEVDEAFAAALDGADLAQIAQAFKPSCGGCGSACSMKKH